VKPKTFKLNNGIKVVYERFKSKKSACIINFNVGSLWEEDGKRGLAHLVEHLMFKSTATLSTDELLSQLEINGTSINAFTNFEYTKYVFKANTEHLGKTLALFVNMLNSKNISKEEFEKEKSVVIQELKMREDDHIRQSYNNWHKQVMNIDPIIGFKNEIESITLDDVYDWINKYYITDNMTVSIVSNKYTWQIKRLLNKHFKNFRTGNKTYQTEQKSKLLENIEFNNKKKIFKEKDNKQTQLLINFPLKIENHHDRIKMRFLNGTLSGGLTSILFREIREKYGYCYNINSSVEIFQNDEITKKTKGSYLNITTSCVPEYVDDCVKQINNVVKNLSKIINDSDIEKVKNQIKGYEHGYYKKAEHNLSQYVKYKKVSSIEDNDKKILKVEKKDVINFAKNNIGAPIVCLYGPKKPSKN
jgi:predicted Zn-dependent peptidase